jgi:hypothetical protein
MKYAALLVTILALAVICTLVAQTTDLAPLEDDPLNIVFPSITVLGVRQTDKGTYQLNLDEMWVNCSPALDVKDLYGNRTDPAQLTPPFEAWAKGRNDGEGRLTLNQIRVLEQGRYDENGDIVLTPKRWRPGYEGRMDYEE